MFSLLFCNSDRRLQRIVAVGIVCFFISGVLAQKATDRSAADALRLISRSPWAIQTKLKSGNPLLHEAVLPPDVVPPPNIDGLSTVRKQQDSEIDSLEHPNTRFIPLFGIGFGSPIANSSDLPGTAKAKPNPAEPAPEKLESLALPSGTVLVLWDSALPVREAKRKLGISDTGNPHAADSYVVSVIGYSLAVDLPVKPELKKMIMDSAALIPRGSQPLTATDVELGGSPSAMILRYFFPRQKSIQQDDKQVLFQMQVGLSGLVEATFILRNMLYDGKLAIADYPRAAENKPSTNVAHGTPPPASDTELRHLQARQPEQIREPNAFPLSNPSEAQAHYDRGVTLGDKGDLDGAIAEYREALRLEPSFFFAHNNLGNDLAAKGDLDAAIAELRKAVLLNPKLPDAHNNLGLVLCDKGDLDGAIAEYREALRLKDDAMFHDNLGYALSQKGNKEAAIAEYKTAIRLQPDLKLARTNLVQVFIEKEFRQSRPTMSSNPRVMQQILEEQRQNVKQNPGNARAHYCLGYILTRKASLDAPATTFAKTVALRVRDSLAEAISEYEEALRLEPDNALFHYDLGAALAEKGSIEGAIREYRATIKLNPRSSMARNDLSTTLFTQGDFDESIVQAREAVRLNADLSQAHYNLGLALEEKGQNDAAIKELTEAQRLDPGDADTHYEIAFNLDHMHRDDEAIAEYRQALRLNPNHAFAHYRLGRVLHYNGKDQEASKELAAACALQPQNSQVCKK